MLADELGQEMFRLQKDRRSTITPDGLPMSGLEACDRVP